MVPFMGGREVFQIDLKGFQQGNIKVLLGWGIRGQGHHVTVPPIGPAHSAPSTWLRASEK